MTLILSELVILANKLILSKFRIWARGAVAGGNLFLRSKVSPVQYSSPIVQSSEYIHLYGHIVNRTIIFDPE